MKDSPRPDSSETVELLDRARQGDRRVLDDIFTRHRERLRRMVDLRMAPGLRKRIDASDVIQEAFAEAAERLPDYLDDPSMPFFLWLRFLVRQRLVTLHRRHLGTRARDPRREVSLYRGAAPEATTDALVARLIGRVSSPSEALVRAEMRIRLQEALDSLDPKEREILALRHFEQLSNGEAARELEIGQAAASKRYIRALTRLRGILANMNITFTGFGRKDA